MKKEDVPQDKGILDGKYREVCYAVDEHGNYVQVLSVGWDPKVVAMTEAWSVINENAEIIKRKVLEGKLSPLAFHMEKNMMDVSLLSQYSGISKSLIKKHLTNEGFNKASENEKNKYATSFNISLEDLLKVE